MLRQRGKDVCALSLHVGVAVLLLLCALHESGAPHAPPPSGWLPVDVLKVDIDSFDCDMARSVLERGFTPKLVWVEINWDIPPPLRLAKLFEPLGSNPWLTFRSQFEEQNLPFFGCSLSYSVRMFGELGYELLQVDGLDAIFVHKSLGRFLAKGTAPLPFVPVFGKAVQVQQSWVPLNDREVFQNVMDLEIVENYQLPEALCVRVIERLVTKKIPHVLELIRYGNF